MGKHLSNKLKVDIEKLNKSGIKAKDISISKRIPLRTVYRIINNPIKYKNNNKLNNRGRPRKLEAREKNSIIREIKKNTQISLKGIVRFTETNFNKSICRETARNLLKEFGYKSYIARKVPFLSRENMKKRVDFSKEFFSKSIEYWKSVIWSDECTFKLYPFQQKRYWKKSSKEYSIPITNPTKKYGGGSVMVWACFSYSGVGNLVFIDQKVNSLTYQQILVENLKESAKMMLLQDFIFQQDNAPAHSSKLIKKIFEENKIKLLPWPAQSPDLNPIENLWAILGSKLSGKKIYSTENLKSEIMNVWSNIDINILKNLAKSMPNRLRMVISNNGKNDKY